ncbi:MAG TPA: type II toxin-antitoxin system VapC family toxin [Pyrinomonadaceae bacterium]|nr:type II toxin-antitoxin system VapC family toxin [Pyrinomonadaceae bacterium]
MSYLFDSNNFLRLAEKNSPERQTVLNAVRKLRAKNEILCYTPQVLAEFWNVCTRPPAARGGLGLTLAQTERKVNIIQKYFLLLPDNLTTFYEWRQLVSDYRIMGVTVHDAKIAASMIAHNIQFLVTFNVRDFQRFPMITVIHPKDI